MPIQHERMTKSYSNMPVIKVISNMFMICISLLQEELEIKYWLEEYEKFLNFVILSACNTTMKSSTDEPYLFIQEQSIDVITFGLAFLLDEYYGNRKDSLFKSKNLIYLIFYYRLFLFMYSICIYADDSSTRAAKSKIRKEEE